METLTSIFTYVQANSTAFIIPLLMISYLIYYRKFHFFKFVYADRSNGDPGRPRGSCPPFFPNGWYRLSTSNELKAGEAKNVDCVGRNVVLFRGTDNIAYVLDAYCAHMGANLGVGGKVLPFKNYRIFSIKFDAFFCYLINFSLKLSHFFQYLKDYRIFPIKFSFFPCFLLINTFFSLKFSIYFLKLSLKFI